MTKRMSIVFNCALVVLLLGSVCVVFSREEVPSDTFVRELERLMIRDGWETSETGEFSRYLYTFQYENLEGVDPELVALALQYARGRSGEDFDIPEMAMIASQVMNAAGEMAALGFKSSAITSAALEGVRQMLTYRDQLRTGESAPETASQLREQLRLQVRDCQTSELKSQIQTRTRSSNPHDPEEWTPPGPGSTLGGSGSAGSPGTGAGPGSSGVDNSGEAPQTAR